MPLEFDLDFDRGIPIYRQIYEAVVSRLASGALDRGEQLPTIHELAARLEVNPNTVARSYRELEHDGHIVAKRGRGTFPAPEKAGNSRGRDSVLESIYERAVQEAARHGISVADVVSHFRRAQDDD